MEEPEQQQTKKDQYELKRQEKMLELKKEKRRTFLRGVAYVVIAIIVVIGVVVGAGKLISKVSTDGGGSSLLPLGSVAEGDWVKGPKDAKVVLIEYSDFQCPACAAYHPLLKQLTDEFNGKIVFVYRHFPLGQHKQAELAARAAEAAGKQGKFWEMHDVIFEHQNEWAERWNADEMFMTYAGSLGLDTLQFKNDMNLNQEIKTKISKNYESGISARVNATPSFFLNGDKIENPRSYEEFKNVVQKMVSRAQ